MENIARQLLLLSANYYLAINKTIFHHYKTQHHYIYIAKNILVLLLIATFHDRAEYQKGDKNDVFATKILEYRSFS